MNAGELSRRSPVRFVLLVFGLSLPCWLAGALAERVGVTFPFRLPISALQFVCPAIAACILISREEMPGGVGRLLKRTFDFHRITRKIWYLPMLLLMPAIMATSYALLLLLRLALPVPAIPLATLPVLLVVYFVTAAGEELGWTGYATDPLQDRWGALFAGMMLGVVWAVWHVIPYLQAQRAPSWIVWQLVFTIAARVLIVWLYNTTGKSIFAAILFHAMIDVTYSLFPNNGSAYNPAVTGVLTVLVAIVVMFVWGRTRLAVYEQKM